MPLFYPRTFGDMRYGVLSFPLGIHPVGQVMARAAQSLGIGAIWAGAGTSTPSRAQIGLIGQLRPTLWMGMSSYGLHLANLAEMMDVDLAAGSVRHLVCSASR